MTGEGCGISLGVKGGDEMFGKCQPVDSTCGTQELLKSFDGEKSDQFHEEQLVDKARQKRICIWFIDIQAIFSTDNGKV